LRAQTAIAGIGQAGLGEAPGRTSMELLAEASMHALDDACLSLNDVYGMFALTMNHFLPALSAGDYLGFRPRFSESTMMGGSSFVAQILRAMMALTPGQCEVALIAYGSNQRTASGRLVSGSSGEYMPYEAPYKPRHPISAYALAASRHMYQYGTTREQLAEVAVAARAWARLNPEAFERGPLSIEDVINARMISDPFTRFDCCLVTDGGAAMVLTRAERAQDLQQPPVYVLGSAFAHWHRQISQMADLTVTAASDSGKRAYRMAGVTASDIDVLELDAAFTINTILFLEDLGFCAKGEGGPFVADGAFAPGGKLPVNTNGGGLSCVHPGMYGLYTVNEAVRQLRGECGERQIAGAEIALAHGNGGTLSSQATTILGTQVTL
jgi:acetyl-CoA acetyltransferase